MDAELDYDELIKRHEEIKSHLSQVRFGENATQFLPGEDFRFRDVFASVRNPNENKQTFSTKLPTTNPLVTGKRKQKIDLSDNSILEKHIQLILQEANIETRERHISNLSPTNRDSGNGLVTISQDMSIRQLNNLLENKWQESNKVRENDELLCKSKNSRFETNAHGSGSFDFESKFHEENLTYDRVLHKLEEKLRLRIEKVVEREELTRRHFIEIHSREMYIKKAEIKLNLARSEINSKQEELNALQKELDTKETRLQHLVKEIKEREAACLSREKSVRELEEYWKLRKEELAQLSDDLSTKERILATREERIKYDEAQISCDIKLIEAQRKYMKLTGESSRD